MIRMFLSLALLASLTANAQTAPATPAVPPPVSGAAARSVSPQVAPLARPALGGGNPFAPKTEAPVAPPVSVDTPTLAPVVKTEDMVRQQVEAAYRAQGFRVGRVNGQTFFKLDKSYLFVPTGLDDAQPVVSSNRPAASPAGTSGNSSATNRAIPPPIPSPPPGNK